MHVSLLFVRAMAANCRALAMSRGSDALVSFDRQILVTEEVESRWDWKGGGERKTGEDGGRSKARDDEKEGKRYLRPCLRIHLPHSVRSRHRAEVVLSSPSNCKV